jgi:hypothetical protein
MWRSLFLALGAYTCLLGVEALAIEKAVMRQPENGQPRRFIEDEISPPEEAPWILMATGSVVVLYSFSIPRRVGN